MNYVRRINPTTPLDAAWDACVDQWLDKLFHLPDPAERLRFSEETERDYYESWPRRD